MKSGTNDLRGNLFEFFRNEALNARNYFQRSNPAKPDYRRNQFGGTVGGPVFRDRTFFFADYQGQRQSIARSPISTVPTLLQREGIFTERIGASDARDLRPGDRTVAHAVSGQHIRGPPDPVALAAQRYPLPTSSGTNNYTRTANEIDSRISGRPCRSPASVRDHVSGGWRTSAVHPVTPLPEAAEYDRHARSRGTRWRGRSRRTTSTRFPAIC
jgi:hypothetical protein